MIKPPVRFRCCLVCGAQSPSGPVRRGRCQSHRALVASAEAGGHAGPDGAAAGGHCENAGGPRRCPATGRERCKSPYEVVVNMEGAKPGILKAAWKEVFDSVNASQFRAHGRDVRE